ncbi:PIPK domain-containing protein, partial [Haematococcus lacustris]
MAYGTRALGNDGPSLASESVTSGLMAQGQGLELQRMKSGALAGEGAGNDKKVVYIRRFRDGVLVHEDKLSKEEMKQIFKDVRTKPKKSVPRTVKRTVKRAIGLGKKLQEKQGQLIYKGMPGYDLMVRLQLGIRYAIGQMQQEQQHLLLGLQPGQSVPQLTAAVKVQPSDFTAKSKVFFPASGSATTPAHASSDFKWKAYSPKVFHNLRLMWGVGSAEFMLSLAGSQALRQLNSPGKSGCLFFLSDDEQYIIKTMRKSEIKTLMAMLPEYYHHMERSKESLVTRFYGVYGVKQVHGRTVRFVVMSNIFATGLLIHKKFDLKGSTFERTAGGADPGDAKSVFKDLDLDLAIQLPKALHEKMCGQLQADSQFLEAVGVMDYSLLLGHTERAPRNFDIYNNQEEVTQQLTAVETRMKAKGFDEQRIQDILGLAKLKILGEKLKKSKGPAGRGRHMQSGAASVVKALAQARQEPASSQETESGLVPVLEGAACLRVPAPGAGGDTTEDGEAMDSDSDKDSDKLPDSPR